MCNALRATRVARCLQRVFSAKSRHPYSKMCVLFVKNNRLVSDLHYRFVGKYANLFTPRIHTFLFKLDSICEITMQEMLQKIAVIAV